MRMFQRLFGKPDRGTAPLLYDQVVALGRAPHWYAQGQVPDTIDGRFDMIAAVLAMVLLRLETELAGIAPSTALAECFIEDMDSQLREIGIGDVVVGKHMGKMMGMLGGRLGAFRAGLADGSLRSVVERNIYRGQLPEAGAIDHVAAQLLALRHRLDDAPVTDLLAGELSR
ncbi:ubiquinol-cytochrome C chaperone family protein [Sphingomonas xinjiangensis]|uniref:Cytochrome b pre-mRNA-processing protein 3 n=1 Tax=Sphingomonas xinjiangensis TaxID=643568 RepID=A0A840YL19_9SPHN|nr:ubiquinol-cytochrome C chaperone family protein [Sphingomonas xinjiangensis]MBB5711958.1 cytochrome b pre-mRNA-processing protein 3 [Sphingomonas xinjiangensis]